MTSFNCKAIPTMPLSKCSRMPFLSILLTISCCFFQSSHSFVNRVGRLGNADTFNAIRSSTNLYISTANPLTEQGPRHATSSVSHNLAECNALPPAHACPMRCTTNVAHNINCPINIWSQTSLGNRSKAWNESELTSLNKRK